MTKGIISGGVCGFITVVEAERTSTGGIRVTISSNCKYVKKLADGLTDIDPNNEFFTSFKTTRTCDAASRHLPHPSCIVPSGILKTIEVEAGLAMPQEASIKIE